MANLKFADSVWHRVVQIVQEGILMGTDVSDGMRQITVVPDETDPHVLVLSPEYERQVREMHGKLLDEARELHASSTAGHKFIIPGSGDPN